MIETAVATVEHVRITTHTVDGSDIRRSRVEVGTLSHYLYFFKYIQEVLYTKKRTENKPIIHPAARDYEVM